MKHELEGKEKFWSPRFQAWMTLEEREYRKMLERDAKTDRVLDSLDAAEGYQC